MKCNINISSCIAQAYEISPFDTSTGPRVDQSLSRSDVKENYNFILKSLNGEANRPFENRKEKKKKKTNQIGVIE